MSAPGSRPVHPCVLSLTEGTRGAEHSTWAYITTTSRRRGGSGSGSGSGGPAELPNLVTAAASTLSVYSVLPNSGGRLRLERTFPDLAGSVVFLGTLSRPAGSAAGADDYDDDSGNTDDGTDALLIGFAGHPRLTVVRIGGGGGRGAERHQSPLLRAVALLDLTPALQDASWGAAAPLEQDAMFACTCPSASVVEGGGGGGSGLATVSCVLGGGVAVAVVEVAYHKNNKRNKSASAGGWVAHEPYVLPLASLSANLPHNAHHKSSSAAAASSSGGGGGASGGGSTNANFGHSMSTGFGDIISATFLSGYLEPVLVLLHSDLGGRTGPGRLGRQDGEGGAPPLYATALSVSVTHSRTALLWSRPVTADALFAVSSAPSSFGQSKSSSNSSNNNSSKCVVVVGTNTITVLEASGTVQSVVAVNGWARSTCPVSLQAALRPNPIAKLSLSLDGCAFTWVSPQSALLALRTGQVYVFQRLRTADDQWTLLPTGTSLGAIGEVEHLMALPLDDGNDDPQQLQQHESSSNNKLLTDKIAGDKASAELHTGLVFAGSRLGNSLLLGYALESIEKKVNLQTIKEEPELAKVKQEVDVPVKHEHDGLQSATVPPTVLDEEYDRVLRMEEDALYAPTDTTQQQQQQQLKPDVVPPSDDEVEGSGTTASQQRNSKRQRLSAFTVVRCLTPLDSLVNLGPIGASCQGPLSGAPPFLKAESLHSARTVLPGSAAQSEDVSGTPAYVFPSGFGSSGGIALATLPGRDDRMILAEQDCLNVGCVFSLSSVGLVLLGMSEKAGEGGVGGGGGGVRVLRLVNPSSDQEDDEESRSCELEEVSVDDWSERPSAANSGGEDDRMYSSVADVFRSTLHGAGEFSDGGSFGAVVSSSSETGVRYAVVIMKETDGVLGLVAEVPLRANGDVLLQTTPFVQNVRGDAQALSFVCLWSSGKAEVVSISSDGNILSNLIGLDGTETGEDKMEIDDIGDDEEKEINLCYKDQRITSVDIFHGPKSLFTRGLQSAEDKDESSDSRNTKIRGGSFETGPSVFDEDDEDLYGLSSRPPSSEGEREVVSEEEIWSEEALFVAVCRQCGRLEVYSVSGESEPQLCWTSSGCGQGVMQLQDVQEEEEEQRHRLPRSHKVSVREMRFFWCGTSIRDKSEQQHSSVRSFCLSVETSSGDIELYVARRKYASSSRLLLEKASLKTVFRQSQEQVRHHTKLVRKRIVGKEDDKSGARFCYSRLHRFSGISGQEGLFAACARPAWLVAERGRPTIIFHRTRHAAPAGGIPRPVSGFCSGFKNSRSGHGGFLTLHERVGRIGSQRLTAFYGLSKVFTRQGILSGNHGLCLEKIPMGVTVRHIEFINDGSVSTADHPLYAVLVSREVDEDQSFLNSDGLSREERQKQQEEKEGAKIKKQVEADLGGFDIESEWVEEIEREDCFKIDTDLGGAPPIREQAYSVWIVDAANKWMVVDSFELDEFEHGMTMKVMNLTDFPEAPGRNANVDLDEKDLTTRLFIAVGTGYVDLNAEDVSSKGRVLLLEVKKPESAMKLTSSQVAELSLVHEKNIFHGPVSSLSCLSTEGRNRLVVGAGPDVNIEQWGTSKLTQVGFFRATMQVLDILLFKNFFLLSDAFDSLYFLVWRESDKSLTLLAKDYDPIPVHATGLISRGAAMTFLCHDDRQNIQFFQYAPGEAAARGGNKLVCRGDFHLGSQTTSFSSHFCRSSLLVHSATPASTLSALKQQDSSFGRTDDDQKKLGALFGTTDGGLGAVVPLSEPVYWRLTALQSVMANALEGDCALSPRAWRLYRRTSRRGGCRSNDRKKGVIDGDVIVRYADLPKVDQEDLASSIGSTVDLILDNILELQCGSMMI